MPDTAAVARDCHQGAAGPASAGTHSVDGQVYTAASAVRWLCSLGIISGAEEMDAIAAPDNNGGRPSSGPGPGTTGREGKTPNPQQITAWRRKNPHGNTARRAGPAGRVDRDMMDRAARCVAGAEDDYRPGSSAQWAERFSTLLRNLEFLPNSPTATVDDVRAIYLAARKAKVKGITVYRYGSREGQVLSYAAPDAVLAQADTAFSGGCIGRSCEF